jgi:PAS domain S-box-containing protein
MEVSTILIVDDELFGRKTLGTLLHAAPYHLVFASSGEEALKQATLVTPDLILLDVMMPDMDGFEVCRHLRADPHLAEVPVIMVTALGDRDSRLLGIEAGADDLVSKPFDPVELRARVRTITRLNRYRRLMSERAKFERLTELAPDGIAIVDTHRFVLLANSAMRQMLGLNSSDVILGRQVCDFIAEGENIHCVESLDNVIVNESHVARFETGFVRQDGTCFPVEVNAGHVSWNGTAAIQLIVRDITERKRVEATLRDREEQLRRSRDMLRLLFDGLEHGFVLLDSEGTVLVCNQAMSSFLNVDISQIVGKRWKEICAKSTPPFPARPAIRSLSDGRARHFRESYTGRDEQPRTLDIQVVPLFGLHQAIDQVIVHVVDITEQLHLETLAIQNENFAARGRLAAIVAHEINTPLQSIQNCLYLAQQAEEVQRKSYLQLAREELRRISTIVRQLLDLRHLEEEATLSPININGLVERVLLLTGGTLTNHGIETNVELHSNLPPICGYANHLTQVLLNIILNAIDAMPDGGKLSVRTVQMAPVGVASHTGVLQKNGRNKQGVPQNSEEAMVMVEIADTGCGMTPLVQARIFDPFFTTKSDGSGVGLALSQRIISQHRGRIEVKSTIEEGSTFTLLLPIGDDCLDDR